MKIYIGLFFISISLYSSTLLKYPSTFNRVEDLYKVSKLTYVTQENLALYSKAENIQDLLDIAVKENKIKYSEQFLLRKKFQDIDNGDLILLKCLKNSSCDIKGITKVRRITNIEKNLTTSQNAKKVVFDGRIVIKRNVFTCSKQNIMRMLKGNAPYGIDGNIVNLHHLKQQKMGSLVELTSSEHNRYSKTLHRYTNISEITDRNSGFQKFRTQWWKKRALECKVHQ